MAAHRKSDRRRDDLCAGELRKRKSRLILAIQPRFNHTPYDISEQRRTQVNILGDVMPECYAIADSPRFYEGSDPNGIRTRVTAVKGRCPGPLDDRVKKPGNIGIATLRRKANRR